MKLKPRLTERQIVPEHPAVPWIGFDAKNTWRRLKAAKEQNLKNNFPFKRSSFSSFGIWVCKPRESCKASPDATIRHPEHAHPEYRI